MQNSEIEEEKICLDAQVLHRFGYDANGNRVAERRSDGTLVFRVGGFYEYSQNGAETHTTLYYGKEVFRVDGELRFILTDHLGFPHPALGTAPTSPEGEGKLNSPHLDTTEHRE